MRRLALVMALVLLLASLLPVSVSADDGVINNVQQPLMAGQHTEIGYVRFYSENGTTLTVQYKVTEPGWGIPLSHLYVGPTEAKKLAPGSFPYQHTHEVSERTDYTYTVDISGMNPVYVAAHCEAEQFVGYASNLEMDEANLPAECATFSVSYAANSYLTTQIQTTSLAGSYEAWCVDADGTINIGQSYNACVQSSYDFVWDPAVFPVVPEGVANQLNYIINNYPQDGYTMGDVQHALWALTGQAAPGRYVPPAVPLYDPAKVDLILEDAAANGLTYEPGCGDRLVVMLIPVNVCGDCANPSAQITIISVPVTCVEQYEAETAWAEGGTPFARQWGWYNVFGW